MSAQYPGAYASNEYRFRNASETGVHVGQGFQAVHAGSISVGQISYNNYPAQATEPSLVDALGFAEMSQREYSINEVHPGTGDWLLESGEYLRWALSETQPDESSLQSADTGNESPVNAEDCRHAILWIVGNAGAGKSTLMKMALEDTRAKYQEALILSHFFNARGTPLEKSSEGLYRTLLVWLLEGLPSTSLLKLRSSLGPKMPQKWAIPQLTRLLKAALREHGERPVVLFIDALDECEDTDVHNMLKVFRELVRPGPRTASRQQQQIRVCFASRPYPYLGFRDAELLSLSDNYDHIRDVEAYINDELDIGHSAEAMDIHHEVVQKSQGLFIWAVFVVERLNDNYNRGNMSELQKQVNAIPPGLQGLFSYILAASPEHVDAVLVCFQWLLFANDTEDFDARVAPLFMASAPTLWWVIQLGLGRNADEICYDHQCMTTQDMQRWIVNISQGLVEFDRRDQTARFAHKSVGDYIIAESQLQQLYGAQDYAEFRAHSFEKLRDCCTVELEARRPRLHELVRQMDPRNVVEQQRRDLEFDTPPPDPFLYYDLPKRLFPCWRYARMSVLAHATKAQLSGRDQSQFLDHFIQRVGPFFSIRIPGHREAEYTTRWRKVIYGSLISVLLENDFETLIREAQLGAARSARLRGEAFGLVDGIRLTSPVARVVAYYNQKKRGTPPTVIALVDLYVQLDQEARDPRLQQVLLQLAQCWDQFPRGQWWKESSIPLLQVASHQPLLASFFLIAMASPQALVPYIDELNRAFKWSYGTLKPFVQVLKLFVDHGLSSDAIDFADPDFLTWLCFWKKDFATQDIGDSLDEHLEEEPTENLLQPPLEQHLEELPEELLEGSSADLVSEGMTESSEESIFDLQDSEATSLVCAHMYYWLTLHLQPQEVPLPFNSHSDVRDFCTVVRGP
ncbi:hypothetical protein CC79DRAFT_1399707 [Sarocladium strictum]